MVANKKVSGAAKSMPAGIAIGVGVALLTTLGGSLITAWMIGTEIIKESAVGYCSIVILILSTAAGCILSQTLIKRQKEIVCASVSLAYYLLLLSITALFFGGQYQGMGVTALVIAGGAGIVLLGGFRKGKTHNRYMKKYRYS